MDSLIYGQLSSPFGRLRLASDGFGVCRIAFPSESEERWKDWFLHHFHSFARKGSDAVIEQACGQLQEYFQARRLSFQIPVSLKGTDFQVQVWRALLEIPYGTTWSYGEVGRKIGRPQASHAVGGAIRRNPVAIIVPCHRVIGKNGALVGFRGGLHLKENLLKLEKVSRNSLKCKQ